MFPKKKPSLRFRLISDDGNRFRCGQQSCKIYLFSVPSAGTDAYLEKHSNAQKKSVFESKILFKAFVLAILRYWRIRIFFYLSISELDRE